MTKTNEVLEVTIHNVETGQIVTRPLNNQELAQQEIDAANAVAQKEAETHKAAEKSALLARLGITEQEAKLLIQ
jgi:hypothetical protein